MQKKHVFTLILIAVAVFGSLGCRRSTSVKELPRADKASPSASTIEVGKGPIAVSDSYLAAAVRDLLGAEESLVMLAEPGMCPGHFDLRPSQVSQLHDCRLLVRFNFQQALDSRLSDDRNQRPQIITVTVQGSLCEPASYRAASRQIAEGLVQHGRLAPAEADRRLADIQRRMDQLSRWSKEKMDQAALLDKPALASGHQAAFCRWLGLKVVETFASADTVRPSMINAAIDAGEKAGVILIVANRPEGRDLADALADRLGAEVVVFSNFPEATSADAFDHMVRHNIDSLVEAAHR